MKSTIGQFIKFGIVEASNVLISLRVYYSFVLCSKDMYMLGNFAGWAVSVLNAFYWGNKYVFVNENNSKSDLLKRLGKSYISYASTFLLSQILLLIQVRYFNISEFIAPIVTLIITIPLNFIINKLWTFRK